MRRYLKQIAQILTGDEEVTEMNINWGGLRYADAAYVRSALIVMSEEKRYRPSTINGMLTALRGVLKQAWLLGQIPEAEYRRAVTIENLKDNGDDEAGRYISFGEIQAVSNVCFEDKGFAGVRDSAIIGLMATCGLRRDEVATLTLDHVDIDSGAVVIVSDNAKSKKNRTVWLRGGALLAMEDWLFFRDANLETSAVFVPINKGNKQQDRPLSAQSMYDIIKKRADEANVSTFSPHDFRRTLITDLLEMNTNVFTVMKIAGHEDPKTTARYDRRGEKDKQEAATRVHYPHRSRRQKTLI